jgi:cytochrome P450
MIYDPYSREMQEDPYPAYAHFREQEPCAYNPKMDFYALFRFEDVWDATLDWETYSSSLGPTLENRGQIPGDVMSIIGMDPPRHVKIRNLASRGFTPRRIAALEDDIRAIAKKYMDPLRDLPGCDFQEAVSSKLPMDVISALLGIPESERDSYRLVIDRTLARNPDTGEMTSDNALGMREGRQFLVDLLEERRGDPRDDLISILAAAEYEDVDGQKKRLTTDEAVAFVGLLAAAGFETTTKLLGNCIVYLARHADQRGKLWADPSLFASAIEEVLRFDARSRDRRRLPRSARVRGSRPLRHYTPTGAADLLRPRPSRLHREVSRAARDPRGTRRGARPIPELCRGRGRADAHLPGSRARLQDGTDLLRAMKDDASRLVVPTNLESSQLPALSRKTISFSATRHSAAVPAICTSSPGASSERSIGVNTASLPARSSA